MLLVQVYVDKSSIHGLGVFAAAAITAGTETWRFTRGFDLDLDPKFLENQSPRFLKRLMHFGYIDSKLNRYILCCDDARFMNHSETPNLQTDYTLDKYGVDIAVRDIMAGEELTIDYMSFENARPALLKSEFRL